MNRDMKQFAQINNYMGRYPDEFDEPSNCILFCLIPTYSIFTSAEAYHWSKMAKLVIFIDM